VPSDTILPVPRFRCLARVGRLVRGRLLPRGARIGIAAPALAVALLASAGARADDPGMLRSQGDRLRSENATLADRAQAAVLELYALESGLARAERRLTTLRTRSQQVAARRDEARRNLQIVRRALALAEDQLGARLRTLYIDGDADPLAILLGSRSLDEALTGLDNLGRLARQDKEIISDVKKTRADVRTALRTLAAEQARLARLTAEAEAARDALLAARSERTGYLAEVRRRQGLNSAQIGNLTEQAQAAEVQSQEIESGSSSGSGDSSSSSGSGDSSSSSGSPPAVPTPAPPGPGTQMTVQSTGYALRGTTATGIQTTWGVVAVDPSVIPLGTRMTVPGYGEGVAADTGGAVKGLVIDLWFPTREQALAWGRRTVTITLH
jgi:3D (Asp-Asp-Asp) domain-containing protein/peptidoglycan hydrolase CwlO-like protein